MLFPPGTSGFLFFLIQQKDALEGLAVDRTHYAVGRYGSSRDEAAVDEFAVVCIADILSKGFVIEDLFYGWVYTKSDCSPLLLFPEFPILPCTYKKGKTIKIFSKP